MSLHVQVLTSVVDDNIAEIIKEFIKGHYISLPTNSYLAVEDWSHLKGFEHVEEIRICQDDSIIY